MTFLSRLFHSVLGGRSGASAASERLAVARLVVVDVDVTGTDISRDRVTGIAALPVVAGRIRIPELRYCALAGASGAPTPFGTARQGDYQALRDFVGASPLVTYNLRFVREMILRSCEIDGLPAVDGEWIDLAVVAEVVGSVENELSTMRYWLAKMKSGGRWPHDAAYDVFAMAQLLQVVVAYSEDAGIDTVESLVQSQRVHEQQIRGRDARTGAT